MEYWARILLNEQKGYYHPSPLWLYRESQYSTSQSPEYNDLNQLLIKEFKSLWEKRS